VWGGGVGGSPRADLVLAFDSLAKDNMRAQLNNSEGRECPRRAALWSRSFHYVSRRWLFEGRRLSLSPPYRRSFALRFAKPGAS